jgi:predicted nucleic acid-binding protein
MVVVDSSVLIASLRGRHKELVNGLKQLLDADQVALAAPVRLEILAGAPKAQLALLRRLLSALPLLLPSEQVWKVLEGWVESARGSGERFGARDLLIAGIAEQHSARIWSLDGDFERMAQLGLIQATFVAPG